MPGLIQFEKIPYILIAFEGFLEVNVEELWRKYSPLDDTSESFDSFRSYYYSLLLLHTFYQATDLALLICGAS